MNMATHAKTRRNIFNFDISYKTISPVSGEQSLEAQLAVVLWPFIAFYAIFLLHYIAIYCWLLIL